MASGILLAPLPLAPQKSVHFRIDELAPLQQMLALASFVTHAQFFQNVARRRVVSEVRGKNPMQLEIFKPVAEQLLRRLGRVTLPPVEHSQPVAKLGMLMLLLNAQTDSSDLPSIVM